MVRPRVSILLAAALALATILLSAAVSRRSNAEGPNPAAGLRFELYEPQKAVYHVSTGGGLFGRDHRRLADVLQNHVDAVGAGFADLRVVLQGDGVDLLVDALADARLAERLAWLRKAGVRFLPCYNTLLWRRLDYARDLFGVKREDVVSAGVAEIGRLQAEGFAYIRF
ncbi:MAG TPA: DsrE family protein [Beijerinckiaceae bacterium]|jgi:intracellular sulfur oxidation DsrE/DsrF family protein